MCSKKWRLFHAQKQICKNYILFGHKALASGADAVMVGWHICGGGVGMPLEDMSVWRWYICAGGGFDFGPYLVDVG